MKCINYAIVEPKLVLVEERLEGEDVQRIVRVISDLKDIFEDKEALDRLEQNAVAYEVCAYHPVNEGISGGLFYGVTSVYPHLVGEEYMMTKGHWHVNRACSEFYWGMKGEGVLLLMNRERVCRAEKVFPGSLHYIPGETAHRMVNTSDTVFSFGACWPSDAGHDYEAIQKEGFSVRVKKVNGQPQLVKSKT